MKNINSVTDLPNVPAVYAMYGGRGRGLHVAYVGLGDALKRRVYQHLVYRDSSVATGTSAAALNPDYVTEVRWWEHPDFSERYVLQAAELVAFDILDPALRSRGAIQEKAKELYADEAFNENMMAFFQGEPTGRLVIPTLQDALEKITELDRRLDDLEKKIK
jgi:hypothetical protein